MRILTGRRYETLDGLRGVAALCVMAGHFGQILDVYWPANMYLAVDVFFMMSGFVIAHSYGQRLRSGMPASSYLGRRLVRLYPMFIAGLLIGAGALYSGVRNGAIEFSTEDILHSALLNAVYLPFLNSAHIGKDVGQIFPADPPAWSLFLEMLASVGFLLLCGLRRRQLLAITILSFALLLCAGLYFARVEGQEGIDLSGGFSTGNMLGGLPRVGFGFTLGVLMYDLVRDGLGRRIAAAMMRVPYASFVLYLILIAVLLCPKSIRGAYPLAVLTAVAPAIVLVSAQVRLRNALETRIAWFLGWISYPIYCLHVPIMRSVLFGDFLGRSTLATLAVSTVTTLVATVVLTRWYEEPLRATLSRRLAARRSVSLNEAN